MVWFQVYCVWGLHANCKSCGGGVKQERYWAHVAAMFDWYVMRRKVGLHLLAPCSPITEIVDWN